MSAAELIGLVPAHWSLKPLRLIGRLLKGSGGSKEDAVEDGVPCVRYGDLYTTHNNFIESARTCISADRASDYTPIEYGDVLFAASGETIEEIGKSAVNLLVGARCGGDVIILRPAEPTVARFLGYATDAAPVAAQKSLAGRGTTVKHIYPDELRQVVIAIPPLKEQQAIANYLDRETARIDALVAAKQHVLDLLAEKRTAIITAAVTRGLDPKVKLRDCGLPWLDEIPAHWALVPLRHLLSLGPKNGISPPQAGSDGALSFSISAVRDGRVTIQGNEKLVALERSVASDYYLMSGDILLVRGNGNLSLVGTCGLVETAPDECTYPDILMLMRVGEQIIAEFLVAAINSPYVREQIESLAQTTNGTYKLSGEDVRTLRIALPPMDQQRAIVEHLVRQTAKLDAVRAATERTIAFLRERRAALIAAAVTGKLDIGAAP